jgi:predicted dehydrogenase
MGEPLTVAIVGCGNISDQYLEMLTGRADIAVVAVTDLDLARARAAADRFGVRAVDPMNVYAENAQWILNLTTPAHHHDVAMTAIAHGKCLYTEKPLCATTTQAREVLSAAREAGVVVAGAPDTVLGTGIQTARAIIDSGRVGRPVAASATMAVPGHELWHPNPDFYYSDGGGPLLDMGPYYVTALITLLGPVVRVFGAASHTREARTIATGPRAGAQIPVGVDTHVTAILEHSSGALSTLVTSFDAAATGSPHIEVHGEAGSVRVPDPNMFDGTVQVHAVGGQWEPVEPCAGYVDAGRGIGLVDIAHSVDRRTARASGDLAYHVLDVMESVLASADSGVRVEVASTCAVPAPVSLTTCS